MAATVVDHPVVQDRLTRLRHVDTDRSRFRHALHEVARLVVYESLRDLPVTPITVPTPLTEAQGATVTEPPMLVPILRAGLGMLDAALELVPDALVGFVGLRRDEQTLRSEKYLDTVPADLDGAAALVLDPMLATGGSMIQTCRRLRDAGAGSIVAACILAAPEGVAAVEAAALDVAIYTAAVDPGLNEVGFIVPGLGDAGDRLFGTA